MRHLAARVLVTQERGAAAFAITGTGTSSGEVQGAVGLVAVDSEDRTAEVGYWVAPAARGRGIATAAIVAVSSWSLGVGGLTRLKLLIDPENVGSCRAAERADAILEGVMRSKANARAGQRCDIGLYAILPRRPGNQSGRPLAGTVRWHCFAAGL